MTVPTDSPTPGDLILATRTADIVDVPARVFITSSGAGAPDSPAFAQSIAALYGIAYGIKFGRKKVGGSDFKVGALVGTWRIEGPLHTADEAPARSSWRWTLQLDMPPDVTQEDVRNTAAAAAAKKGGKLQGSPYAAQVTLARETARRYGRILHLGAYSEEPESFRAIEALLGAKNLHREPWHVEVYLSDPGRTAQDKLRTVLLVPVTQ